MLRVSTAQKVWNFDFLRGLDRGYLDEISSEKYEKKCESFVHFTAKFEKLAKLASTLVLQLIGTLNSEMLLLSDGHLVMLKSHDVFFSSCRSVAIGVTAQVDALSIEMGIITTRRVRGAMAREDERKFGIKSVLALKIREARLYSQTRRSSRGTSISHTGPRIQPFPE